MNFMLNQRIRSLRQARHMSQVELAKRIGVTKQCVCNWENDNIQPSIEMLVRLTEIFSVSADNLLGLGGGDSISVNGLSQEEIAHIQFLVDDLRKKA